MAIVLMNDVVTGRVAMFAENGTAGSPSDPAALRNAPLNNPAAYLSLVKLHSDFDYYQVHSGPTAVTISHPSVAAASVSVNDYPSIIRVGQVVEAQHVLVTHNLGYVPAYMVVSGGAIIAPGTLIQTQPSRARRVTPYATTTQIKLQDQGISSSSALSAMSKTYSVIVFRAPVADSSYMLDYNPATGAIILAKGKFKGALKALRKTALGDTSPFDIALGPTIDIKNGAMRYVGADGTTFSETDYDGSFAGSASIQCTVE